MLKMQALCSLRAALVKAAANRSGDADQRAAFLITEMNLASEVAELIKEACLVYGRAALILKLSKGSESEFLVRDK